MTAARTPRSRYFHDDCPVCVSSENAYRFQRIRRTASERMIVEGVLGHDADEHEEWALLNFLANGISELTYRMYIPAAARYLTWCARNDVGLFSATVDDVRRHLAEVPNTMPTRHLAIKAVRRLYRAMKAIGLDVRVPPELYDLRSTLSPLLPGDER